MLNPFPDLLTYSYLIGPLLIRLALGGFFMRASIRHVRLEATGSAKLSEKLVRFLGLVEFVLVLMFFVGFLTQIAALIGAIVCGFLLYASRHSKVVAPEGKTTCLSLLLVNLSLLFLGAGAFAFDLFI